MWAQRRLRQITRRARTEVVDPSNAAVEELVLPERIGVQARTGPDESHFSMTSDTSVDPVARFDDQPRRKAAGRRAREPVIEVLDPLICENEPDEHERGQDVCGAARNRGECAGERHRHRDDDQRHLGKSDQMLLQPPERENGQRV